MKRLFLIFFSGLLLLSLSQCSKEGPVGPQGPKGETGAAGAKGDKGDKGDAGNANVKSSGWIKVVASKWDLNLSGYGNVSVKEAGEIQWYSANGVKQLSNEEQSGVVLVYVKDGYTIRLCPFSKQVIASGQNGVLKYRFSFGSSWAYPVVALSSGSWDATYIKNTYLPTLEWNFITIPPGTSGRMTDTNVDYSDYKAVCAYYGLPE